MSMRSAALLVLIIIITTLLSGCNNSADIFSIHQNKKKYIGIQPLGEYNKERLNFVREQITHFYRTPVIILPPKPLPKSFINRQKGERYCADSILLFLKALKNDSIVEVVGLVHKDIYTTKKDRDGNIQQPVAKYAVWGICGLGYLPGDECIISDLRLKTKDSTVFKRRLKTVVIHEIGHNLGLPHCKVKGCIMSDTNEKVATLDKSRNDYCDECKLKLKWKF
ncbi:MAG TPA: matrixin family metalloprotease [Chitinophagaceae bacterium]|nr:matrixin family metalloprotease [Chitinophagaceae bacterium]